MINSVINLFQTNKEKDKEKNSLGNFRNKPEINAEKGKHLCMMYWCEEHIGINNNEPVLIKSNNLKDLMSKDSTTNINRYKRNSNQTNTKCSSCNII